MKDIIKHNEAQLENCNGDHTNTNALTDFFSTFWGISEKHLHIFLQYRQIIIQIGSIL